jgi:predicted acylesterase/phospholipase RssA
MSTPSSPKAEYAKEVRFAVVMYGGVSLAIYINGVAQELLRMVRSTAESAKNQSGDPALLSGAATATDPLKGTERVYRKLSYLLSDDRLIAKCRKLAATAPGNASGSTPLSKMLDALIEDNDQPVSTKFVVDILSGTSAGGINAIYLAKALANDQQIDQLKDLWINEGDIALLLNDRRSVVGLNLRNQNQPQSLLNSRRMYFKLLKSLEDMEDQRPSVERFKSPYVDELDLFITATDIEGVDVPLRLSDGVVFEKRHRSVFRFRYGKAEVLGVDFNDFLRPFNPFLAFAARCTSSFPFAFEPMRLADIQEVVELFGAHRDYDPAQAEKKWKRYFFEELDPKTGSPIEPPRFSRRSFGDGGYLDNKPFSYATETLSQRQADVPVDRKLIYIEPSPEHPEDKPATFEKINALQNVKAAVLDLPTHETIREDLQRVLDRNQLIERVNRIVSSIEKDVNQYLPRGVQDLLRRQGGPGFSMRAMGTGTGGPPETTPVSDTESLEEPSGDARTSAHDPSGWAYMDLVDMVNKNSRYFLPYRRLRIASVTDEIARLFGRLANFDEKSAQFLAIRALVRVWRSETFVDYVEDGQEELETVNRFLWSYDFGYRQRRLSFVRAKADELSGFGNKLIKELEDLSLGYKKLGEEFDIPNLSKDVLYEFPQISLQDYGQRLLKFEKCPEKLLPVTRFIKSELNEISKDLRTWGRWLRSRQGRPQDEVRRSDNNDEPYPDEALRSPLLDYIENLGLTPEDLTYILGMTSESEPSSGQELNEDDHLARTQSLLDRSGKGHIRTSLRRTAEELAKNLELAFFQVRKRTDALFGPLAKYKPISRRGKQLQADHPGLLSSDEAEAVRGFLSYYYNQFDDYDQIRFPIMYETDYGEADVVEVIRISPEDAVSLIDEREEFLSGSGPGGKARQKLAGISLHHFGAFLDRTWRQNDIMWGRLDGAERLISGLLPGKPDEPIRQELIREAHSAILMEELKPESVKGLQNVISEALMRASGGLSINDAVAVTLGPLEKSAVKTRLEEIMRLSLKDDELLSFMSKGYEVNRQLDPKTMLSSISRSTQIIGKMFEDMASANGLEGKRLAWIARLGKIFWGLIEVAVPRSIPYLMFRHWLKLLYLFEVILIIASTLLLQPELQKFGLLIFGITVAIHLVVWVLSDIMEVKRRWQTVLKYLATVGGVAFVLLGVFLASALLGFETSWEIIKKAHGWFVGHQPGGLNRTLLTRLIVSSIFFLFFLWAIRDDLCEIWLRLLGRTDLITFKPIGILTTAAEKVQIRKQPFTDLYLIPLRLSDSPVRRWTKQFRENWKKTNLQALSGTAVRFRDHELLLFCRIDQVKTAFSNLTKAVGDTNESYRRLVAKAQQKAETRRRKKEAKAAAKKEHEQLIKEEVNSVLDQLKTPRPD